MDWSGKVDKLEDKTEETLNTKIMRSTQKNKLHQVVLALEEQLASKSAAVAKPTLAKRLMISSLT